jgi:hypothetical protein
MSLNQNITANQVNPQPNPTPQIATNATTPNANWDTFSATPAVPSVPSSVLANPGTVASPPTSSPNVAPFTADPALIITTADARQTVQWLDGSYKP